MALKHLGTNANNSLSALKFLPGYGSGLVAADLASLNALMKNDQNVALPQFTGLLPSGLLTLPGRGVGIQVMPGDVIGVDSQGCAVLVFANSIANGPWTFA